MMVSQSIPQLHLLEQVSSTENAIGTLAEKLLEALRANTDCDQKVNKKTISQVMWLCC